VDEIIPHRLWGQTTIKAAAAPQRELNILDGLTLANAHVQTMPRTYTMTGGISREEIAKSFGKPFYVGVLTSPHLKPVQDYPGPLPHGVVTRRETLLDSIEKALRLQEQIPPSSKGWPSSGKVIEEYRESAQVEIRDTADNLGQMVVGVVTLIALNTQQFYKKERYARITGPLPQALAGLVDPTTGKEIVESPDGEEGGIHYVKFNPENLKGQVDIHIVEAAYRPMSMAARFDKVLALQERYPDDVTFEHALMQIDFKGKEKMLRDWRAKQEPPPEEEVEEELPMPPAGMPPMGAPPMAPPPGMMPLPPGLPPMPQPGPVI